MNQITKADIERIVEAARDREGWQVSSGGFQMIQARSAIRVVNNIFVEALVQSSENADFIANAGRVIVAQANKIDAWADAIVDYSQALDALEQEGVPVPMGETLAGHCQSLGAKLVLLEARMRWRDAKIEFPPKMYDDWSDDVYVIRDDDDGMLWDAYHHGKKEWKFQQNVTHWMFRPQPPNGGER